jgi:hypothetical protein
LEEMGKFFKTLISSVKSFKSPSKHKAAAKDQRLALSQEDRNASYRKDDDDQTDVMVNPNLRLCFRGRLKSLAFSSSQEDQGFVLNPSSLSLSDPCLLHSQKKGCLWSLSKSSSRNREIAIHITSPDAVESGETQEKQGKEEEQEQKEKQEKQKELEKPSSTDPELHSSIEPPRAEFRIDEHRLLLERSSSKKIQRAFRSYQVFTDVEPLHRAGFFVISRLGLGCHAFPNRFRIHQGFTVNMQAMQVVPDSVYVLRFGVVRLGLGFSCFRGLFNGGFCLRSLLSSNQNLYELDFRCR